jgi:hypothetical protein
MRANEEPCYGEAVTVFAKEMFYVLNMWKSFLISVLNYIAKHHAMNAYHVVVT